MAQITGLFVTVLQALHSITQNYGWAIVIFSALVKMLLYYPTQQQYRSMKEMQVIQPELKKIQERHKDDPQRLQQEQMELFKRHNVNPLGGCLPLLLQMPILIGIYGAIREIFPVGGFASVWATIKTMASNQPPMHEVFLWIGSPLSHHLPQITLPFLGQISVLADSLQSPDVPMVLLYGASMFLSQRLSTPSGDPAMAQQQKMMNTFMPIFFTIMMFQWKLPSALVLYWFMFNIFSVIQQVHLLREPAKTLPPPPPPPETEVDKVEEPEPSAPAPAASGTAVRNNQQTKPRKGGRRR